MSAPMPAAPPASTWLDRNWPPLTGPAPRRATVAVTGTGLVAAVVLNPGRPGVGWLVVALALATTGALTLRREEPRARRWERAGWLAAAVALVGVGTVRADGELFAWCLLAALPCLSVGLAGGRTLRGLAAGAGALLLALPVALPWWGKGLRHVRGTGAGRTRVARTVAISVGLLVVFGTLFATADPAFAHLLGGAAPPLNAGDSARALIAALLCVPIGAAVAFVAASRPAFDDVPPLARRPVRRGEFAWPLGLLTSLFLAFVLVQLTVLFGGRDRVLLTAGLTYAQYARTGFWQLLVIAALSLAVIGVAARYAPRATPADRAVLRGLLGTLAGLTLVIVASALHRLSVYQDAYGLTRERLAVGVTEAWLGLVFVLVLVAGIRLRATWLLRVAAGTAALALLGTAYAGPDRIVAAQNVARYERTGRIDTAYLSTLSADALPDLTWLPPGLQGCATNPILASLSKVDDDWRTWNAGRAAARDIATTDCDPET